MELTGQFYFSGERRQAMNEQRRHKIMQAAERLFAAQRYHEITMEEVARRAGVGKGTLYRYFKDKDTLFFEVAVGGYDELCRLISSERRRTPDFQACLLRCTQRISDFYARRRQLVHVMPTEERRALKARGPRHDLWVRKKKALISALALILEEGRKEKRLRKDVPVNVLAVFLLGMLRTRGREHRAGSAFHVSHDTVVSLFLEGAAPPHPGPEASAP